MNCIDAHQHFWNYNAKNHSWINEEMQVLKKDFTPSDLRVIYTQNNIDGCVAVQVDQTEVETEFLLGLSKENDFIKGVVGWVDLMQSNIAERLELFSQQDKLCGFRHIVQSEPDPAFMLQSAFKNGISLLSKYDFTYDILIYPHQLESAISLVNAYPNQKFVLDHIAKPYIKDRKIEKWKKDIQSLSKRENVFVKVSGMVTEADWNQWQKDDFEPYMDTILEAFGAKRIMFGSDWPVCLLAANYTEVKQIFVDYISAFSESEQEYMLYQNAINFYNLKL